MGLENFNLVIWLQIMLILVVAITVHEFAHALAADRLGDPLPRSQGRISLNPVDHLDPTGTLLMAVSAAVGFGIGWGRPVQYNPSALKNPRLGSLWIALWGPLSNLLQAALFAAILRADAALGFLPLEGTGYTLITLGVLINLALFFFNLIPIPPLDGFRILSCLLPLTSARRFEAVMAQWGVLLFLVLVFTRVTSLLIGPPVAHLYGFLVDYHLP